MSDGFDKEAERERLRKKYEDDQADREVTERMSELLLQGATMTNKHCNRCGSPIFRYQGQEFCPSCQTEVEAAEAASEAGGADPEGADAPAPSESPVPDSSPEETTLPADSATETTATETTAAESTPSPESESPTEATPVEPQSPSATTGVAEGTLDTGEVSLDEAIRTLVRTITTLSERAERAEDPRRAKDLLAAAREAAETLATLRGGD